MALTTEKQTELIKSIGIDPETIDSVESALETFGQSFVKRDQAVNDETIVSKIVGSRMGKLETFTKQQYKGLGVEFEPEEIKGKKLEEIIELGNQKLSTSWKSKEEELKKLGDAGEGSKAWEEKYQKLEKKFGEVDGLNKNLKGELETILQTQQQKERDQKIGQYKTDQIKDAKLRADIDALTMTGFNTLLNSKYVIDLDEAGNQFVKDAKSGTRIASKKKAGDFADFSEVFEMEAREHKLWSDSPHGGKPVLKPEATKPEPDATKPATIASRAMQLAGRG